jgi:hypothetical protein
VSHSGHGERPTHLSPRGPVTTPINGYGSVVPDRSFEFLPDEPLAIGASGDVLAARNTARGLLARTGGGPPAASLATLVLTAALLHADTLGAGSPSARDVGSVLRGLVDQTPTSRPMASSRVQFAAYAAAELGVLPPGGQADLVNRLLGLLDPTS